MRHILSNLDILAQGFEQGRFSSKFRTVVRISHISQTAPATPTERSKPSRPTNPKINFETALAVRAG